MKIKNRKKLNIRFLPYEKTTLAIIATELKISTNDLILRCLEQTSAGDNARSILKRKLAGKEATTGRPINRIQIRLRLGAEELRALRSITERNHTLVETIRERLGFKSTSYAATKAARARIRQRGRVITANDVARYRRFLTNSAILEFHRT